MRNNINGGDDTCDGRADADAGAAVNVDDKADIDVIFGGISSA